MKRFELTVYGEAQPAGSKRGFVNPKSGRVIITDDARKSKPWKQQVAQAAGEVFEGPLWDGPLRATFVFYRPRPRSHYGTGRNSSKLKPSAPWYPTTRPDLLKYARAVEDALTGIVWTDDSRICDERLHKRYGEPARVWIVVERLEAR